MARAKKKILKLDSDGRVVFSISTKEERDNKATLAKIDSIFRKKTQELNGQINEKEGKYMLGMKRVFSSMLDVLNVLIEEVSLEKTFNHFKSRWPHWFKDCCTSKCNKPCRAFLVEAIARRCFPAYNYFGRLGVINSVMTSSVDGQRFKIVGSKSTAIDVDKAVAQCEFHPDKKAKYNVAGVKTCYQCKHRLFGAVVDGKLRRGASSDEVRDHLRALAVAEITEERDLLSEQLQIS